jgi:hypothetical protein
VLSTGSDGAAGHHGLASAKLCSGEVSWVGEEAGAVWDVEEGHGGCNCSGMGSGHGQVAY